MNISRSASLVIGILVILIMLLFPPFHVIYAPGIEIDKGYAFVLNPPVFWGVVKSTVNYSLLAFQIGTVGALFGALQILMKMRKK